MLPSKLHNLMKLKSTNLSCKVHAMCCSYLDRWCVEDVCLKLCVTDCEPSDYSDVKQGLCSASLFPNRVFLYDRLQCRNLLVSTKELREFLWQSYSKTDGHFPFDGHGYTLGIKDSPDCAVPLCKKMKQIQRLEMHLDSDTLDSFHLNLPRQWRQQWTFPYRGQQVLLNPTHETIKSSIVHPRKIKFSLLKQLRND